MARKRHFRSLVFKLECGHTAEHATSFWRVDKRRGSCIIGACVRRGVWCNECKTHCQIEEYKGTCRTGAVDTSSTVHTEEE